jgi:hypothetical protein
VTYPAWSVTCSGGVEVTSGVERAKTSAPRTTKPRVSDTCTRIDTGPRRDTTRLGVNRTPSITRRAGSATLETGIDVLPFASLICPAGSFDVVVVLVDVVVVVGAVVEVVAFVEVVVLVLLVSVDVEPVVVEPVVLDVVSASAPSGPAVPALAK